MWNPQFDARNTDNCDYKGWDGAYDSPYAVLSELPMNMWGSGSVELTFIGTTESLDDPMCVAVGQCGSDLPILATIEGGAPGSVIVRDPSVRPEVNTAYLWAFIRSEYFVMQIRFIYDSNSSAPSAATFDDAVAQLLTVAESVAARMPEVLPYYTGD